MRRAAAPCRAGRSGNLFVLRLGCRQHPVRIRFGRPDASDAQVRNAAAAVGADDFIAALPNGYRTEVAGTGVPLSAGQRQLIALARVLLADPAVLIVDEATSSLDLPGERAVRRALRTVSADRTTLVISQRLDAAEGADRVLLLGDQGRIVADDAPDAVVGQGHPACV
ncbi:Putative multidrug export ATP-binding/permease protein [Mycobacterium pseudokansasii]|nr:Putative multidrug export ATP-binding/permease protein [Mycobacterium pseudokansasii]VBA32364.1 Putative multidrug export ATP-binding/permease protein [Mycobacterium pseudokansasii]